VKISKSQIILTSIFVLFLALNFLIRTSFAQGTVVEVLPSSSSGEVGQSFAINIMVVDVQNLYAVDVIVNWNSSVLQLVNIDVRIAPTDTDGVLYNPFIAVNSTYPGYYEISATSQGPYPFNGTGNIVIIAFSVIGSGYSSINLTKSELWDYGKVRQSGISMPIDHSTVGGQFSATVVEIPDSAIFLAFTVLTVSALVLSRKMSKKVRLRHVFDGIKQDLLTEGKA
jgi:hypothetical protein